MTVSILLNMLSVLYSAAADKDTDDAFHTLRLHEVKMGRDASSQRLR